MYISETYKNKALRSQEVTSKANPIMRIYTFLSIVKSISVMGVCSQTVLTLGRLQVIPGSVPTWLQPSLGRGHV